MTEQMAVYEAQPGFLAPVVTAQAALAAYQAKKDLIDGIMHKDVDFGIIPGSSKPTLLKAGAEKATSFFGLSPRFKDAGVVEDWTGEAHGGEPFFYYRRTCELWRGNMIVASVDGSCNSFEKKYRYRSSERTCPTCGKATIIKGKEEYGGGWLCYAKKGGCGAKFGANDPAITGQETGTVKNPDVADLVNTILKMADKRALVAATLIATGLSEYFTQDIEDYVTGEVTELPVAKPAPKPMVETIVGYVSQENWDEHAARIVKDNDQTSAIPAGNVTPTMLVELGLSENIPAAGQLLTKLKLAGHKATEALPIIRKYRAARDAGKTTDEAAAIALA